MKVVSSLLVVALLCVGSTLASANNMGEELVLANGAEAVLTHSMAAALELEKAKNKKAAKKLSQKSKSKSTSKKASRKASKASKKLSRKAGKRSSKKSKRRLRSRKAGKGHVEKEEEHHLSDKQIEAMAKAEADELFGVEKEFSTATFSRPEGFIHHVKKSRVPDFYQGTKDGRRLPRWDPLLIYRRHEAKQAIYNKIKQADVDAHNFRERCRHKKARAARAKAYRARCAKKAAAAKKRMERIHKKRKAQRKAFRKARRAQRKAARKEARKLKQLAANVAFVESEAPVLNKVEKKILKQEKKIEKKIVKKEKKVEKKIVKKEKKAAKKAAKKAKKSSKALYNAQMKRMFRKFQKRGGKKMTMAKYKKWFKKQYPFKKFAKRVQKRAAKKAAKKVAKKLRRARKLKARRAQRPMSKLSNFYLLPSSKVVFDVPSIHVPNRRNRDGRNVFVRRAHTVQDRRFRRISMSAAGKAVSRSAGRHLIRKGNKYFTRDGLTFVRVKKNILHPVVAGLSRPPRIIDQPRRFLRRFPVIPKKATHMVVNEYGDLEEQ